jgi:hypothetical protein
LPFQPVQGEQNVNLEAKTFAISHLIQLGGVEAEAAVVPAH